MTPIMPGSVWSFVLFTYERLRKIWSSWLRVFTITKKPWEIEPKFKETQQSDPCGYPYNECEILGFNILFLGDSRTKHSTNMRLLHIPYNDPAKLSKKYFIKRTILKMSPVPSLLCPPSNAPCRPSKHWQIAEKRVLPQNATLVEKHCQ